MQDRHVVHMGQPAFGPSQHIPSLFRVYLRIKLCLVWYFNPGHWSIGWSRFALGLSFLSFKHCKAFWLIQTMLNEKNWEFTLFSSLEMAWREAIRSEAPPLPKHILHLPSLPLHTPLCVPLRIIWYQSWRSIQSNSIIGTRYHLPSTVFSTHPSLPSVPRSNPSLPTAIHHRTQNSTVWSTHHHQPTAQNRKIK